MGNKQPVVLYRRGAKPFQCRWVTTRCCYLFITSHNIRPHKRAINKTQTISNILTRTRKTSIASTISAFCSASDLINSADDFCSLLNSTIFASIRRVRLFSLSRLSRPFVREWARLCRKSAGIRLYGRKKLLRCLDNMRRGFQYASPWNYF